MIYELMRSMKPSGQKFKVANDQAKFAISCDLNNVVSTVLRFASVSSVGFDRTSSLTIYKETKYQVSI